MQAFCLGFHIVNTWLTATIGSQSPGLEGARATLTQMLGRLVYEAQELGLDTSTLTKLLQQSHLAKIGDTFDNIRSELIRCGESFSKMIS